MICNIFCRMQSERDQNTRTGITNNELNKIFGQDLKRPEKRLKTPNTARYGTILMNYPDVTRSRTKTPFIYRNKKNEKKFVD